MLARQRATSNGRIILKRASLKYELRMCTGTMWNMIGFTACS
jgi:hypothetical protein